VGVVAGDRIVLLEASGVRDIERDLPATPETPFYIASVTKTFLATAVMQLVEEGRLELDAPVVDYLPRFRLADSEAAASITVRDLITHARGINSFPVVFLDAYSGEITEDRYYHFLAEATPSGETAYTNVHFTLAGRVVEAVSSEPWRDYLAEHVFAPAGLTATTGYADEMYARENVAYPTVFRDGEIQLSGVRKTDRTMHAAGGLGSSARDLSRWILLHMNGGVIDGQRLLSAEGTAEMQRQHTSMYGSALGTQKALRTREGFGYGWMVGRYRDRPYLQHGGGYVGSAALISFLPEERIGVAVVANTDGAGQQLCELITVDAIDRLLGRDGFEVNIADVEGYLERKVRMSTLAPREAAAAVDESLTLDLWEYEGSYTNEHWGTVEIDYVGGELGMRLGDLTPVLTAAEGDDRFLAILVPGMSADGRFVVEGGAAAAVVLVLEGELEVRFDQSR
jgi:CubicO group peptidase (beta-lactamase class C family)